jgi:hypothetical protein
MIKKHKGCSHGPGTSWTLEPTWRLFTRCDTCGVFRLWADYFEMYGSRWPHSMNRWWWECERCLLRTITACAEQEARESTSRAQHSRMVTETSDWKPIGPHEHLQLESEPAD